MGDTCDEYDFVRKVFVKRIGYRDYQEGDKGRSDRITDEVKTCYILRTPEEYDISLYLPDSNLILVNGSKLTFVQENGALPVPNEVDFGSR